MLWRLACSGWIVGLMREVSRNRIGGHSCTSEAGSNIGRSASDGSSGGLSSVVGRALGSRTARAAAQWDRAILLCVSARRPGPMCADRQWSDSMNPNGRSSRAVCLHDVEQGLVYCPPIRLSRPAFISTKPPMIARPCLGLSPAPLLVSFSGRPPSRTRPPFSQPF